MAKRGPKLTPIDWEQFDKLCFMQCSLVEIASWFDCSIDTIERAVEREHKIKFAEYFEQKRGRGKIALRRKMFDLAQNGNVTLLIWLSKQYLQMADKVDNTHDVRSVEEFKRLAALKNEELRKETELALAKAV